MSTNTQFSNLSPAISLPNMSVPPPSAPNLSAPPPNLTTINTSGSYQHRYTNHRDGNRGFFKPFRPYHAPKVVAGGQDTLQDEFDGKRLRKSVMRKTVDYNSAIIKSLENRVWQRDYRDRRALQPDVIYYPDLLPPPSYVDNPINAVTTRFVKTATNKMRCPIFCMAWTPEGRRLVTGASSGEFTLWNGLTFNFETILQAHDSPVRTMVWSHNESWMVTGDHAGYVKYWQSNMNNVKMFQAHKEAIRGLSFSPTDHKLATCSDDGTVRIWDFLRCHEERILRGHGADVKCVHWHPQKSLVISGSKDNQQPVKLWDPKSGQSLATLHAHKSTVMDIKWNENGNWLVTASRDHLLKLFDLRNLNQEVQTFRGHKKEASSVAWHPSHEGLFCSGGSDGAILFWHVGADKEVGAIEQAHDSIVWTLAWHPLGHILCSGSNDHTSKFWTRNRPGDLMRDKYNLNTLPAGTAGVDDHEIADEAAVIPGMGPEDRINADGELEDKSGEIPGLDLDHAVDEGKKFTNKKVPYSKPIPRNFQAQWNEMEAEDIEQVEALNAFVNQLIETTPGAVPLSELSPTAIILYGKMIPVEPGSKLAEAIGKGNDAINKLVFSGEIEELRDVVGPLNSVDETEDYLQDEGEIDYSKVPDIDLPPPLPSSKFAQNPELLKTLNRGGKRKFDQLIGWSDGGASDRTSKIHQPVFGGVITDDVQSSDGETRYSASKSNDNSSFQGQDEDLRRIAHGDSRSMQRGDEDLRYNTSSGPGRPGSRSEYDIRSNYGDKDFRSMNSQGFLLKKSSENDLYDDKERDGSRWDDEKIMSSSSRKTDSNFSSSNFDKRDNMQLNIGPGMGSNMSHIGNNMSHLPNHHNMQNINPNMPLPIPNLVQHPNMPQHPGMQNKLPHGNVQGMDGPMPHMMHHPGMHPAFGPNGPPPPGGFGPNFRPPNGNFGPNQHFRPNPMPPFGPNQGPPFNSNFQGTPNFRVPNSGPSNFDRPGFGPNFRGQNVGSQNAPNHFNSNFGNFGCNKNGPNRGINRGPNDNNMGRNGYNNRGRVRDSDQSRGTRGRDNY
ncbi:pre-mRNA 3' end processing protein WDR33-like [Vespa mandarinia]|uniref:pre-mRNA 3' end processing protein WDR33-like n=2 Tax=Vespa TaxID=7443 RepID=UPI00160F9D02|nr:pre-mRNA 3' end processing protein WDR33-like [Vespa mandarinia]XP_035734798.1 pre-mRNA 3' end processing protein WDR33-like [Vespa mandarinia]XP_046821219.1 pre-mRNA 3' end processing protein WDR33 isoform X1 [Vespa crabro]XP_046821220.1 pre-mRNA 3' end processing protein WDR33 isoform X1 [Vespa crabro]XP_046821221.1 pre-mRNA 3' end processing protein WDR33 isoform X1 [Vespa crabro]XP_047348769.1 pre-mRNA 3' end processing protein WDR33-like isoform X1 [Vespa velutina]XP_047348770.1 pre-m